ncbi:MAG: hypothetical protein ABWY83_07185 [Actinomycetota bacterium]
MDTTKNDLDLWSGNPDRSEVDLSSGAPETVPAPEFNTTRRGFDQAQVNDYIGRMTERLRGVEEKMRKLRSEADQAYQQRDSALRERDSALRERDSALPERSSTEEEQVSSRVMELMVAVNRDIERLRGEAQGEAEHILARARSTASRMRSEAEETRSAADLAAAQAREEAERSVADLASKRNAMVTDLRLSFARSLDTIADLASSIGGENETREGVRSGTKTDTSMTPPDDQATPLLALPEILPDRSA